MSTVTYPYRVERSVIIKAEPAVVFEFFTDSAKWASWWGAGSTIDARPGGKVYIRFPNGIESAGEVIELYPPEQISFTYGFVSGNPIPPGASRVTITLRPDNAGTLLQLLHEFLEEGPRDAHVQGWRFQLSLFANAVANVVYANAADKIDEWFAAWRMTDENARAGKLSQITTPNIRFADRFSLLEGLEDLSAHISASQRFMPNISLQRKGPVKHCQGTAVCGWVAQHNDGTELATGTDVFTFRTDGCIASVQGFVDPKPQK